MTHEEIQKEHASDVERGVLPAPGEKFATAKVDESDPKQMPKHIRATVRYLTFSKEHGVWVHYRDCDFTGHGNEMFSGNCSDALADFWAKFPVKLSDD